MVLKKRKLYEYVSRDLALRIFAGTVRPGDKLATEYQMCAEFGVSRTVIRDAMRYLASKGLIESRPHSGTTVRGIEHWNFLDSTMISWARGMGDREGFFDMLMEARVALEHQVVQIAAVKATPEEAARIEAALIEMETAADITPVDRDRYNTADIEFHLAILDSTHNLILRQFGAVIRVALLASFELALESVELSRVSTNAHRKVMEAIRDHDPETAREQMDVVTQILWQNIKKHQEIHGREDLENPDFPSPYGPFAN